MPKTKEQKKEILRDLEEKMGKQKSMVLVAIKGLGAKDVFDFREQLKKADCLLSVAKKTLFALAFKAKKIKIDKEKMQGEVGLIFGFKDEITPAKISYRFSQTNENLKILGGFFENNFIEKDEVVNLANLPSKMELLTKVVGSIASPISGFVSVLQGNIKGLILALNAISKSK